MDSVERARRGAGGGYTRRPARQHRCTQTSTIERFRRFKNTVAGLVLVYYISGSFTNDRMCPVTIFVMMGSVVLPHLPIKRYGRPITAPLSVCAAPLTVCAVLVISNGNQYITGTTQHCSTAVLRYLGSAVVLPAPLPSTHASMCAACCCFFCLLRAMLCRRGSSGVSRSGALGSAVVPFNCGCAVATAYSAVPVL